MGNNNESPIYEPMISGYCESPKPYNHHDHINNNVQFTGCNNFCFCCSSSNIYNQQPINWQQPPPMEYNNNFCPDYPPFPENCSYGNNAQQPMVHNNNNYHYPQKYEYVAKPQQNGFNFRDEI